MHRCTTLALSWGLVLGLSGAGWAQTPPDAPEPVNAANVTTPANVTAPANVTTPANVTAPVNSTTPANGTTAPVQTAQPVQETPDFQFSGYEQTSYSYNFNRPSDGQNLYHGYDQRADLLRLDLLDLNFNYRLDQPDTTGFRVELTAGGSMPRVDAAAGLFRDPNTLVSNSDFDIRQAFISHTFDNGLRLDAGKFATWLGYEVMDGVDGMNPNGTRALAFTYNPFTHTGLRLTYPINDHLSVTGAAVMGADNVEFNRSPSFGAQVNYHPTEDFSVIANMLVGPDTPRNSTGLNQFYELIANYRVADWLTLGLDTYTGCQPLGTSTTGSYNGLVFYFLTTVTDDFSVNLREEFFNDPQGARLSPAARVSGFTITPQYRLAKDWYLRVDFRFDRADRPVFNRAGQMVDWQNTFFVGQSLKF